MALMHTPYNYQNYSRTMDQNAIFVAKNTSRLNFDDFDVVSMVFGVKEFNFGVYFTLRAVMTAQIVILWWSWVVTGYLDDVTAM